jgi:hypothetical protein
MFFPPFIDQNAPLMPPFLMIRKMKMPQGNPSSCELHNQPGTFIGHCAQIKTLERALGLHTRSRLFSFSGGRQMNFEVSPNHPFVHRFCHE